MAKKQRGVRRSGAGYHQPRSNTPADEDVARAKRPPGRPRRLVTPLSTGRGRPSRYPRLPGESARDAANRRFRERHRAEERERSAQWRVEHPGATAEYLRAYRKTLGGRAVRERHRPREQTRARARRAAQRAGEIELYGYKRARAETAIENFKEAQRNLDTLLKNVLPSSARANTLRGNVRELYRIARGMVDETKALGAIIERRKKYGRPGPRRRKR